MRTFASGSGVCCFCLVDQRRKEGVKVGSLGAQLRRPLLFSFLPLSLSSFLSSFIFFKLINLFLYLWLCWVLVSVRGLSPVAASGGHSSSGCTSLGCTLLRPLLLRSTGSRRTGSAIVAHGRSRSAACGIFPDQGSNPCPLHWQADSQPLRHQGSPTSFFLILYILESFE